MNVGATRPTSRIWRLTAVFALALIVRLVYNLYIAQHRILDVGDSHYYLAAGQALAKLVRESQSTNNWQAFLSQLCAAAQYVPGSFNSFTALGLSDRLLIDGPIYPSYLAAIFLLSGKALATTALNSEQLLFAIANSVTDSFLAVAVAFLAEISFGVAAGVLAGLLWCFYVPAVINTQQCYGEPVVALILTAFMAALFFQSNCGQNRLDDKGRVKPDLVLSIVTGVLAGMVMLAKPAFVLLPPLLLALHLIALAFSGQLRGRPYSAASLVLGVILALTPWLLYTSTVTGAPKLIVNRAPGYNLYIGNYLPTDGWKTWPVVEGIPDSVADARRFIEGEAQGKPAQLASLLLRKIPRLWAGVWNDFHLTAGIGYKSQNCFQILLLLWALLGLSFSTAGKLRSSKPISYACALTLTYAVAFHFIYVLFEPVPRYAFTAMPLVVALAAAGLTRCCASIYGLPKKWRRLTLLKLLLLNVAAASLCAILNSASSPASCLSAFTQDAGIMRLLAAAVLVLLVLTLGTCFWFVLGRLGARGFLSTWIMAKTFILVALIGMASALSDPAFLEWSVNVLKLSSDGDLNTEWIGVQSVTTQLTVPDLGNSVPEVLYILVDAQAPYGAPELDFVINGRSGGATYPLSMYEMTSASPDIPTLINLQGRMMDVDQRTFRQWWLYPVESKLFHFGGDNIIEVSAKRSSSARLFGDYGNHYCANPLFDRALALAGANMAT